MAPYYPIYLDLNGRACVIIGGGEVVERKIQYLLECGALITIVSPQVTPGIGDMADRGLVAWKPREYLEGDLKDAFIAIAGTDRRDVNKAVADEAGREKVVLNVVDDPQLCTFIAPSIVRKGDVTLAMSTGGASPALARKLRETLEHSPALEYAYLTGVLSRARGEIRRRGIAVHPDRWQECITPGLVSLVKDGKEEQALDQLLAGLMEARRE
jgi:precorrin-2 dehydrogenase/sirohydrochlorin ferrochelatase